MNLPILTYHRILPEEPTHENDPKRISVSVARFTQQMHWLKRLGYQTLSLNAYADALKRRAAIARRSFAITFDDGYQEVLTLGLPILKRFGFSASLFAVTDELGGANRWDDGRAALLSADGLKDWRRSGMEIGAHSCRHPHLTQESDASAHRELKESRERLADLLRERIDVFAYPYGECDERIETLAREAGYAAALATDRAPADHAAHPWRLRRAVVFPKNTAWEIWVKAQPWYATYQDWKRRKE